MTLIQKVNPINKEEEKRRFFFDSQYNPQFQYKERVSMDLLREYGNPSDKYLSQAKKILDTVIKKWGSETSFLLEAEGELLHREELTQVVNQYLKENNLEGKIQLRFSRLFVSPTSMIGDTLNFRLPIAQRKNRILGTLNHELGTHYFRRLNDEKQVWHRRKHEYHLQSHLDTEEGLAVLHSHLFLEHKYMWFAALYYYAIYKSNTMSFAELNKDLKQYIDDRDRRWNITLRAKRGMTDTSVPGAWAKDQVYLSGTISLLRWLKEHDYDPRPLYIGKVAHQDLEKAQHISPGYAPVLPAFLSEANMKQYKEAVMLIEKENML